jgi:hypothetical protein
MGTNKGIKMVLCWFVSFVYNFPYNILAPLPGSLNAKTWKCNRLM